MYESRQSDLFQFANETQITSVTEVIGGLVLVCLKPKSVVAESDESIGVKNVFVCMKQT